MTYFKVLGIVLGVWMVLGGAGALFCLASLRQWITKVYPEARPRWITVVGWIYLALVVWTWGQFVRTGSMENFVVTLVMTLGLAKGVPMIFFYKKFREVLLALLGEPLAFRVVMLSSAAVGLALLSMELFF